MCEILQIPLTVVKANG